MWDLDYDLESQYEDRYTWDDAEEFERNQLALDNEGDDEYGEDVEYPYDEDTEPPF
jgi:hypothetical protein